MINQIRNELDDYNVTQLNKFIQEFPLISNKNSLKNLNKEDKIKKLKEILSNLKKNKKKNNSSINGDSKSEEKNTGMSKFETARMRSDRVREEHKKKFEERRKKIQNERNRQEKNRKVKNNLDYEIYKMEQQLKKK